MVPPFSFGPFVKLHGCRFLYFFRLCDVKEVVVFLIPEQYSLRGYIINAEKNVKKREILAFKLLLIQLKNLTGTERKDFLKLLTSKLWNKKYKLLPIPHEQNYVVWLVKNGKSAFSKLMLKISLSVSGEQASKNTALSLQFSCFRILDTSPSLLDCYFSEISCTYCFREMFNGFWTSNFFFFKVWPYNFHISQ